MTEATSMRERILDAAETRVREVGFNAVSFRDLANDVGVKSASIHYHFRQKEDLGVQLTARYLQRFQARLDDIDMERHGALGAIKAFIGLYDEALVIDRSVCLCAILGAESNSLPAKVNDGIQAFFEANIHWLTKVNETLPVDQIKISPIEIIASLEGAMIVSSAMKNRAAFDVTSERILACYH